MRGLWVRGGLAGVGAGVGLSLTSLVAPVLLATQSLHEVMAEGFTSLIPASVFSFLIVRLQELGKPLLLVGLLLGQVVVGGALGVAFAGFTRRYPSLRQPPWDGLTLSLLLWLLVMVVLVPLVGGKGLFGSQVSSGWVRFSAATLIPLLLFGYLLSSLHRWLFREPTALPEVAGPATPRHRVLQGLALGGLGLVGGGYGVRLLTLGTFPMGTGAGYRGVGYGQMPPEITPNEDFYVVSKNFTDPVVDAQK